MNSSQMLEWVAFIALTGGCLYFLYQVLIVRFLPLAREAIDPGYFGTNHRRPFEWREFQKWLRVGLTAGAGGIAGGLAADAITEFYVFLRQAEFGEPNWPKIASALILAFLGMKLFGPVHAFFERRLSQPDRPTDRSISPEAAARDEWEYAMVAGGLIFILLLLDGTLNAVLERQLDKLSTEYGGWGMLFVLASTALWPGITAFYWTAILSRPSKHSGFEAFLATWTIMFSLLVGGFLLMIGGMLYETVASGEWAASDGTAGDASGLGQRVVLLAICLAMGLLVILIVPALIAAFTIGLPAAIGMEVIRSARRYRTFQLLLTMCLYDVLFVLPYIGFTAFFHSRLSPEFLEAMDFKGLERESVAALAGAILVPLGWTSALLLDGRFRRLLDTFPLPETRATAAGTREELAAKVAITPATPTVETRVAAKLCEADLATSAAAPVLDQSRVSLVDDPDE
jgi:hypothetical protein